METLYNGMATGYYAQQTPKPFINPSDGTANQSGNNTLTGYTPGVYENYSYSDIFIYSYNVPGQAYQDYSNYTSSISYGIFSPSSYSYTYSGGPYAQYSSYPSPPRTIPQIFTDGTSETLMYAEQVAACSTGNANYWQYTYGIFVENFVENINESYNYSSPPVASATVTYSYSANYSSSGPTGVKTGMTYKTCGSYWGTYLMTTRADGVQIVCADGAVHMISTAITSSVMTSLILPDDGVPLNPLPW